MDKRRIKIVAKVLDKVKDQFSEIPKTKEFIDEHIEQERSKENVSVEKVIFSLHARSKKLSQKNIFYSVVLGLKAERFSLHLTKYIKIYCMKLNSLDQDIYLRVIRT